MLDAKPLAQDTEMVRSLLSLKEAVVLSGAKETLVRKDIEYKIIRPVRWKNARLCFRWADVFLMAAIYKYGDYNRVARKNIFEKLESAVCPEDRKEHFTSKEMRLVSCYPSASVKAMDVWVNNFLVIPFGRIKSDRAPLVECYAAGLSRSEDRKGLMGGEAVFRGTRLPVRHIGKLRAEGESLEEILLDYNYLTESDIDFAEMYYRAHPALGRPRTERGGADDSLDD
jgi:uncharacterized protein (DUF433 family)